MKTAVIYNSQTGFTKKYAEWISKAVGADCFELGTAKRHNFDRYDTIVFGGWACAGKIHKISWFKSNMDKWADKTLIAFCTGGTPAESPEIENFLNNNFSEWESTSSNGEMIFLSLRMIIMKSNRLSMVPL